MGLLPPWVCTAGNSASAEVPAALWRNVSFIFIFFFFWGGLCLGRVVGTWCFVGRAGVEFGRGEVEASGEGPVLRHYCSK